MSKLSCLRLPWLLYLSAMISFSLLGMRLAHAAPTVIQVASRQAASTAASTAPLVLYTDIVSGPNSGGENNKGIYLSLFGKNFGATGLGTSVKVYINNSEVDNYRYLGPAKGRSDIQQLTVQIGALGNPTPGVALPVKVVVNGVASNTDKTFMVNPGRILFVNPTTGNDATAVIGDITKPFKTVQTPDLQGGAWGVAKPGDFIVLRGAAYTSVGGEQYFMRFWKADRSSGTPPTGQANTGPYTLMGYPLEDAFINAKSTTHPAGAISGLNGISFPNAGKWAVVADLRIEGGGYDGPISQEIYGDNWRIVNNELTAYTGVTSGPTPSRMAGITGNGANAVWLGNHIHDIQGSPQEAHGIYIDGDGSYEIAYNLIHDIKSGNGFLTYANGVNGSEAINNVNFHHNVLHDVTKHLINLADGTTNNIRIWDNLGYNAQYAALRFNTLDLVGARIWNNTFYNSNLATVGFDLYGALTNDWSLPVNALDMKNNIFVPAAGSYYASGSVGFDVNMTGITNNLWFGGVENSPYYGYPFDKHPITGDPKFKTPGSDFHLQVGSAAIDAGSNLVTSLVTNDLDTIVARPQGAQYDIGAYEYAAAPVATPTPTQTPTPTIINTPIPTKTPTPTPTTTPPVDCTLSINQGALFTKQTQVTLALNAANSTQMVLSNDGGFLNAVWQPYQPALAWTLRNVGNRIATLTVYARFRGANNVARCGGLNVSDDIVYDPLAPVVTAAIIANPQQAEQTLTQTVTLALAAEDQADGSGVSEMQLSTQSDFADAPWQPFQAEVQITANPDAVLYVRVRDGAGNESATVQATQANILYLPLIVH
ncbi:MAG: choice-of-anchor Q domain-containing protein [Caldilineaceae bacterium]